MKCNSRIFSRVSIVAPALFLALILCGCGSGAEAEQERARISEQLCSVRTSDQAQLRLRDLELDFSVIDEGRRIVAIGHFNGRGLIAPSVTIDLEVAGSGEITRCDVSVRYTGS